MSNDMYTTMSIASMGDSSIQSQRKQWKTHDFHSTNDIEGATPAIRHIARKKPDLHGVDDIEGSHPKVLHRPRREQANDTASLVTDVTRSVNRMMHTRRSVNPLDPQYDLPKVEQKPMTPPPIRPSTHSIDDVPEAHPKSYYSKPPRRNPLDVNDIEGTKSRQRRIRRHNRDLFDPQDINTDGKWSSKRHTDPLCPTHEIYGGAITDDDKSHPSIRHRQRKSHEPFFSLTTADIEGATPGFQQKGDTLSIPMEKRRHFRKINYTGDIEGASSGTYKRGLQTLRMTNPNDPDYPSLDGIQRDSYPERPDTPLSQYARRLQDPRDLEVQRLHKVVEEMYNQSELNRLRKQVAYLQAKSTQQNKHSVDETNSTTHDFMNNTEDNFNKEQNVQEPVSTEDASYHHFPSNKSESKETLRSATRVSAKKPSSIISIRSGHSLRSVGSSTLRSFHETDNRRTVSNNMPKKTHHVHRPHSISSKSVKSRHSQSAQYAEDVASVMDLPDY